MPELTNEVDLSTVGDVVLHLYYTALDGGSTFEQKVKDNNAATAPETGVKVFSALNDFAAPAPTAANPYPLTPWQSFLAPPVAPANQTLTLGISPSKFPAWTRGKTISVSSITVLVVAWPATGFTPPQQGFTIAPQAPLSTTGAAIATTLVTPNVPTLPNVWGVQVMPPPDTTVGSWSFEIQQTNAPDFRSLTKNEIGEVFLLVDYSV